MKKLKKIICIISILIVSICKSQSIVPLYGSGHAGENGYYYKDLDNFLNQYEGTWLYTFGNTSLKIVLVKKVKMPFTSITGTYYRDVLVGEYEYYENGVLKINTLSNLNVNHNKFYSYNLSGKNRINKEIYPKCIDCAVNEYRIKLEYSEPAYKDYQGFDSYMLIRTVTENGVAKLKLSFIEGNMRGFKIPNNNIDDIIEITATYKIPFGEYVLIKQ